MNLAEIEAGMDEVIAIADKLPPEAKMLTEFALLLTRIVIDMDMRLKSLEPCPARGGSQHVWNNCHDGDGIVCVDCGTLKVAPGIREETKTNE